MQARPEQPIQRLGYVLGKGLLLFIAITWVFFGIAHLVPGGICSMYADDTIVTCRANLALGSNLLVQYVHWLGMYASGNFGQTPVGPSVESDVVGGIPASLLLIAVSAALYLVVSAMGRRFTSLGSHISSQAVVLTVPILWVAILLLYIFGIHWHVLPNEGTNDPNIHSFWSSAWFSQLGSTPVMVVLNLIKHLVLPVISFVLVIWVAVTVSEVYEPRVANGMWLRRLPVVAAILICGLVVIEAVFNFDGVGAHLSNALGSLPANYSLALDLVFAASIVVLLGRIVSLWIEFSGVGTTVTAATSPTSATGS